MLVADAPRPRRLDKKLRSKNTIEMKSKKELVACSCRPGDLKLGGDQEICLKTKEFLMDLSYVRVWCGVRSLRSGL